MHISYTTSLIGSHQIIRTGIFPFVGLMLRAMAYLVMRAIERTNERKRGRQRTNGEIEGKLPGLLNLRSG